MKQKSQHLKDFYDLFLRPNNVETGGNTPLPTGRKGDCYAVDRRTQNMRNGSHKNWRRYSAEPEKKVWYYRNLLGSGCCKKYTCIYYIRAGE